ncbi:alpha/beta fold hydrolase [Tepidamorphus sp. 3E244]|uniref:alpha/beta fold hydrolase n=1 Tax=Tepidamorphus sp. 3E244 TaxID=3385498 RepID=UPI0038FD3CAC
MASTLTTTRRPSATRIPSAEKSGDGKLDAAFTEHSYTAQDGLRLVYSQYGKLGGERTPVLCLAGLTRNARDFHELASWLSTTPGKERCVIAPDYRGRGRSDYDRNWENYSLQTELQDVLDLLTALDLEEVIIVGTSRGGLISMLMGSARPAALKGVVLNDIGPVIEPQGLLRIRQYMRERPDAKSWDEVAEALERMWNALYPSLTREEWIDVARKIFREKDGRIVPDHDPNLLKPLEKLDLDKPGPPLWGLFKSISTVPVLSVRGMNSDILTAETVAEMKKQHKKLQTLAVPEAGHAPLLTEPRILRQIATFIGHCDD